MRGVRAEVRPGDTFARWTVLGEAPHGPSGARRIRVRCQCGSVRETNLFHIRTGKSRSCGCYAREATSRRNRSEAGNWRGGRIVNDEDYVLVYAPDHPNAKSNGYVPEHRLVMSRVLGRPLDRTESVHHINGDRADNREANLELWTSSHPSGQRVVDKLAWAYALIAKYEGEK